MRRGACQERILVPVTALVYRRDTIAVTGVGRWTGSTARSGQGTCHRLATIVVTKRELPDELTPVPRSGQRGATWTQLSAAMGTGNWQTAQKRHADLGVKPQVT
jgi:hypothetical protein